MALADLCDGCLQDPCICEPDTPELRDRMMAPLRAKGIDPTKPLGSQLGLDTPEGLERVTKHLAAQGILPQRVRISPEGIVTPVDDDQVN